MKISMVIDRKFTFFFWYIIWCLLIFFTLNIVFGLLTHDGSKISSELRSLFILVSCPSSLIRRNWFTNNHWLNSICNLYLSEIINRLRSICLICWYIIFILWSWTYRKRSLRFKLMSGLSFTLLFYSFSLFKPYSTKVFVAFIILVICIGRIELNWRITFYNFILFSLIYCQGHFYWCIWLELLIIAKIWFIHSFETFHSGNFFI